MAASAYIKIKNGTTGAVKSIITAVGANIPPGVDGANGFLDLVWHKKRNDVHYCDFILDYDSPDVALLSDKDQIEVIRSDFELGITEYTSFDGLFRDEFVYFDDQLMKFKARAFSYEHLLTWRDLDFHSGKTNYTKFTAAKAETILKRLVETNLAASATVANGRSISGVMTGFSVEADSARGNTLSIEISHQNLLDALKKIIISAGGDFKVTRTGLTTFRFDWIVPTDRTTGSDAVIFSIENGNMGSPEKATQRSLERTVAIVGGGGEDDLRVRRPVTGPNYNASTNHIEMWIDARNSGTDTVLLDGIGAIKLQQTKLRNVISYDVLQTEKTQVERDYFLHDKVKAVFADVDQAQYVDEISFIYRASDHKELVGVSMVDV
jgi:hypothetical protein